VSGELVGIFAPSKPSDRPFHERAEAIELERVQAEPVFDQAVGRDAWVVLIVVQSEGAGHLCETNTERQADVSRLNAGNVSIKPTQGPSRCCNRLGPKPSLLLTRDWGLRARAVGVVGPPAA